MPNEKATRYAYDLVQIHGTPARVYRVEEEGKPREEWPIVDIQVPLSNKQYGQLISQFDDKKRRWQTSCYTKIFQDELAGFETACLRQSDGGAHYKEKGIGKLTAQLRFWSQAYVDLEALVNNPPTDLDALKILIDRLNTLYAFMITQNMPKELQEELIAFRNQAIALRDKFATKAEIRQFFGIQKTKRGAPCLGKFLANQMQGLSKYASDRVYALIPGGGITYSRHLKIFGFTILKFKFTVRGEAAIFLNRITQAFAMHPSLKYYSDASANIEVKSDSIFGTELNNSFAKVPRGMLDSMRGNVYTSDDPSTQQWTSISEHVSDLGNLGEVDTVIKQLSGNTKTPPAKSSLRMIALVFVANVLELGLLATPRFILSLGLGLIHVALKTIVNTTGQIAGAFAYGIGRLGGKDLAKSWRAAVLGFSDAADNGLASGFSAIDRRIGKAYQAISSFRFGPFFGFGPFFLFVAGAKKQRNEQLEIDQHLKDNLNQPTSVYDELLNHFGSANYGEFAAKAADSVVDTIASTSYTVRSLGSKKNPDEIAKEIQKEIADAWNVKQNLVKSGALSGGAQAAGALPAGPTILPPQDEAKQGMNLPVRGGIDRIEENKINSFMTPLIEIGVGLSDEIIGPMFRKSPGLATLCFLAANATFGALTAPGIAGAVMGGELAKGMAGLGAKIAGATMGKQTGVHLFMNNLFAAFLQWKLTFFPIELVGEMFHGDLQFLEKLMQNPEKLTLGMTVMVGMGWAMQFLPPMPTPKALGPLNLYGDIANIFGHEAHEVSHGGELIGPDGHPLEGPDGKPLYHSPAKWPINSLEYAFLSLKSIFIVQTMAEGTHEPMSEPVRKIFSPVQVKTPPKPGFKERYPVLFDITEQMKINAAELAIKHGLTVTRKNGIDRFEGSLDDLIKAVGEDGFRIAVIDPAIRAANEKHHLNLSAKDIEAASKHMLESTKAGIEENNKCNAQTKEVVEQTAVLAEMAKNKPESIMGKRQKLTEAIETVIRMEQMGRTFDTIDPLTGKSVKDLDKANAYYHYLYTCFKEYNAEQRRLGHPENEIDKDIFLHAFYNKHCYQGSNNLMRLFSFFPGYPVTVTWRYTQSFINNSVRPFFGQKPSAALNEKLDKSWAKDKVIGYQWLAIGGRVGHELVRAYTFGSRAIYLVAAISVTAAFWIFPVGPAIYAYRLATQGFANATYPSAWKGFNNRIDEALSVAPYEHQGRYISSTIGWFGKMGRGLLTGIASAILPKKAASNVKAWAESKDIAGEQARAARTAGIGSENLLEAAFDVQKKLAAEHHRDVSALVQKKASASSSSSSAEPEVELPSAATTHLSGYKYTPKGIFTSKAARQEEKATVERYGRGVALMKERVENLKERQKVIAAKVNGGRPSAEGIKVAQLGTKLGEVGMTIHSMASPLSATDNEKAQEELKKRSHIMADQLHIVDKLEQEIATQEKMLGIVPAVRKHEI